MSTHQQLTDADAQGRSWAEKKADAHEVSAWWWPDEWDPAWNGTLELGDVSDAHRAELLDLATHAAAERWLDLLAARRELQNDRLNAEELEVRAVKLLEQLRNHLPEGLSGARDGSRVFVLDSVTGRDRTVGSLEDAWRVVHEWREERARL